MVIQPGFADRHHARMARQVPQFLLMTSSAASAAEVSDARRRPQKLRDQISAMRDRPAAAFERGADADHPRDAGLLRPAQHPGKSAGNPGSRDGRGYRSAFREVGTGRLRVFSVWRGACQRANCGVRNAEWQKGSGHSAGMRRGWKMADYHCTTAGPGQAAAEDDQQHVVAELHPPGAVRLVAARWPRTPARCCRSGRGSSRNARCRTFMRCGHGIDDAEIRLVRNDPGEVCSGFDARPSRAPCCAAVDSSR